MKAVTHLEKVITGEVSAVTHLEKVIAEESTAVTYTEKVIAGEATPITHLQKVIAGVASPVTHLEQVWAGGSPTPSEHEYTGAVPVTITANGQPLIDYTIYGNMSQTGTPTPDNPIQPQGTGDLETVGAKAGQYKIPISSANTTTPVYLSEVQTTRKVKKYIFDGTEQWQRTANGAYYLASSVTPITNFWHDLSITSVNSHFAAQENVTGSSSVANNKSAFYAGYTLATKEYYIAARDIADVTDFKSYLAAQYAAGTPVTVWYVLATEETGIVNEPLMKIGEYADTLSMEQAGVSIPTLNGQTVIDVDTTLKPSEMYIKYKG